MNQPRASGGPFEALGDANRREILRLLSGGDKPVQEIAAALPISRPAVSRHLRLLKDAGMVAEQAQGTRRIYHLQEQGMRAVQAYLEGIWGEAAVRFRLLAENTAGSRGDERPAEDVLRRRLLSRARVHRLDLRDRHLVAARPHSDRAGRPDVVLQGGVGGRIYERTADGVEHDWGEVTVWEPPTRLAYLWHLGRDRADATEVEIRFLAQGAAATRVEIEHRGWERLGSSAGEWRDRNVAGGRRCCRTSGPRSRRQPREERIQAQPGPANNETDGDDP